MWEYMTVDQPRVYGALTNNTLNEFGKDRWELCGVSKHRTEYTYYFKRPVEPEADHG